MKIEPTTYTIFDDNDFILAIIESRGNNRWAIKDGPYSLSKDRKWDYETSPSNRNEKYLKEHRFLYDEAEKIVKEIFDHE